MGFRAPAQAGDDFDPNAYAAEEFNPDEYATEAFNPEEYLAEGAKGPGMLSKALGALDSVTGAPVRSAIGAAQDDGGIGEILAAYKTQFGADPDLAPTGKEIAQKFGVPDTALSEVAPGIYSETGEGWALQKGGMLDPTASGAAGLAVDIAADPTNLIPGAAFAKVGKVAAAPLKVGGKLKGIAEQVAFKGSGAMLKDFRSAAGKGRINQLGRFMLDNKLLKAGDTFEDVATKASKHADRAAGDLDKLFDTVEAAGVPSRFDRGLLRQEIEDGVRSAVKNPTDQRKALAAVGEYLDDFTDVKKYGQTAGAKEVRELRQVFDGKINYGKQINDLPEKQEAFFQARKATAGAIDKKIDDIGKIIPDRPLKNRLKALNKEYGNAAEIAKIAKDRSLRDSANRFFGLTDTLLAGSGAVSGGVGAASQGNASPEAILKGLVLGAATGMASKGARTYGLGIGAKAADVAGKALSPRILAAPLGAAAKVAGKAPYLTGQALLKSPKLLESDAETKRKKRLEALKK